ncbi:MAG: hypothetical protein WC710_15080 [Gallionella sp.]
MPKRLFWGGVAMAVVVLAVFWPVLGFDFVRWDDDINVTQNPMMNEAWSWKLAGHFFDPQVAMRFKPLHWVTFRALSGVAGMNPSAWHGLGLGLHALTAVMLFLVFGKVLRLTRNQDGGFFSDGVAWLGAAIWALHPLRVEPVAWITGSPYLMAGLFLAGSFWAYMNAYTRTSNRGWLFVSWTLAVAAYLTYPVSVTYGLWLMAADFFLLRISPACPWMWRDRLTRRWWFKHVLFLAPAACATGVTLWTRLWAPGMFGAAPSMAQVSWVDRLLGALATLSIFPEKFIWPASLTPNQPPITGSIGSNRMILAYALITLVVVFLAYRLRKKQPAFMWGCLGFAGLALPCLGLTEALTWPVDRYSYVLDMVIVGGLVGGLLSLPSRWGAFRPVWISILCVGLSGSVYATRYLLPAWRNSDALFAYMERHPEFDRSVQQAAHIYKLWSLQLMVEKRPDEANKKMARANEVYLSAMSRALREGNYGNAVGLSYYMEANLRITPVMRRERGAWLLRLGRLIEARRDLETAMAALPGDVRTEELLTMLQKMSSPGS